MAFSPLTPWAIFDLDGLLAKAPYDDPRVKHELDDPDFWHAHWSSTPDPHTEMVELLLALNIAGWQVAVLTGRPEKYRAETVSWLAMNSVHVSHLLPFHPLRSLQLVMRPDDVYSTASAWKLWQVEEWMAAGMNVRFLLEDHKPTADVLRRAAPVLLYERQRL